MTDLAPHLARLPAPTAEALARAIEFSRSSDPEWQHERALWNEALTRVGFTRCAGQQVRREIPPASALTPEQRIVAEIIAHTPGAPVGAWPLFKTTWLARRWLGLEPGGVAFEDVELELDGQRVRGPRLLAIRRLLASEPDRAIAALEALPRPQHIELLVIMAMAPADVDGSFASTRIEQLVSDADDGERGDPGWATRIADWVLERYAAPYAAGERPQGPAPREALALLLLTAMIGAGEPLESRHHALLRLAWGRWEGITRRCIEAIPEPQREAALLGALEAMMFDADKVRVGLIYLPDYPYPALADKILDYVERADDPKKALAKFQDVAKRHPELAARLAAREAAMPAIPELRVAAVLDPVTLDRLDAVRRRQLELASERYGGVRESAATILARGPDDDADERILPSCLALRTIVDEGGAPVYDAWLYMVDSGTVFRHGTEEIVAELIQGGVESRDKPLRAALPSVLGALAPAKKAAAKKPAAKKPAAKKPAAKKPAAKKPAAKKPAAKKPAAKKRS